MAASHYSGDAPVQGVYVADDGGELRYYLSEPMLLNGILGGYVSDASHIYGKRPASLQYFGPGGAVVLTAYVHAPKPVLHRTPRQRSLLAEAIKAYREALEQGGPLPGLYGE